MGERCYGNEELAGISDPQSLARLLKFTLNATLQTQQMIGKSTQDLQSVKHRVGTIECEIRTMDQYSRKDVSILTGLEFDPEEETEDSLVSEVIRILRDVNPSLQLTYKDFSAIHRNGRKGKQGKPPSVTIKFLRFYEKHKFMSKDAKTKFKGQGLNIFHALCTRMLEEQKRIERMHECNYVLYNF